MNTNKNIVKAIFLLAIAATLGLTACKKDKEKQYTQMRVSMHDAPGDFQEVNVEVKEVQVHHEVDGWITMPTNAGVYDLLTLQNDISVVLVNNDSIPVGVINQMRLILGDSNYVMVDSVYHNLATPSAEQTGLKFNLNHDFQANETYEVVIDFDAAKSIVIKGNGSYSLKPVIKVDSIIQL
ncbi:MAG: DUF4382 domain-containing protein [Crocinitomicaceae bacterium]|jgi:hypothetical protein|nr:DUF4382 domain-containing protein [Crocinitomicaceae bacterium]